MRSLRDDSAREIILQAEKSAAWEPIDELVVGNVVRVETRFETADEPLQVMVAKSTKGVVEHVDSDGDALIRFPSLGGLRCNTRWVLSADFGKMSRGRITEAGEIESG